MLHKPQLDLIYEAWVAWIHEQVSKGLVPSGVLDGDVIMRATDVPSRKTDKSDDTKEALTTDVPSPKKKDKEVS